MTPRVHLVVDASVALLWFFPEAHADAAAALLDERHVLHVPDLFFPECGNVVWKKTRLTKPPEISVDEGRAVLDALARFPLSVHPTQPLLPAAYALACGPPPCTVYDCCYLALALELECRLVTADRKLLRAQRDGPHAGALHWIADAL